MTLFEEFNNIIQTQLIDNVSSNIWDHENIETFFLTFQQTLQNESQELQDDFCQRIYDEIDCYPVRVRIYILSFLIHSNNSPLYTNLLLELMLHSDELSTENLFFLYYQIIRLRFTNAALGNDNTDELMLLIYKKVYSAYKVSLADSLVFIPKEDRNPNLVIVFVSQFLGLGHAPTKTVLDRCSVIKNQMHKTPLIINTAELLPISGFTPFFSASFAAYLDELLNTEQIEYGNEQFAFIQCDHNMPNLTDIKSILNLVRQLKPYCIFNVGSSSIINDICSNIIPTITIATVFSDRSVTEGQFQVIGRPVTDTDRAWLVQNHKSPNHLIECQFTFSFKPQETKFTRSELGLPEGAFIGLVVGARLDLEVTEDFIQMLCHAMEHDIFIVFMGMYHDYQKVVETHPIFKDHSKYLGFVSDVLAVNECCDIYINPKRQGGGSSVAEALSKGLPAVTLNYGDVGVCAGIDFCVSDYDAMQKALITYSHDSTFYETMSKKALARADILTDSATAFSKVLAIAEQCEEF